MSNDSTELIPGGELILKIKPDYQSGVNHSIAKKKFKQNSRGWRQQHQQNIKTNYRRQKAHVNMQNKSDICAVLLSYELSIAQFHVVCKRGQ